MIDFPCSTCGRAFSVSDDEAGRDIQCPDCGILLAIPLPSDLVNLNADGTLRMTVSAPHVEPDRLTKLQKAFGKMGSDGSGGGFDASAPPDLIEIAPLPEPRKPPPRYDPETGERVVELAVAKKAPVAAIPVRTPRAQMGTVSYATPGLTDWMSSTSLWLRLFQPANMM